MTRSSLEVVRLAVEDLAELSQLEECCFSASDRWSETSWRGEVSGDQHAVFAVREPELVAAAALAQAGDDVELLRVMTLPAARRRGLAAQLLAAGHQWATQCGAQRVLLEVEADNVAAIGLYRKLGYASLAQRRDYYGAGRDALIMARQLDPKELEPKAGEKVE